MISLSAAFRLQAMLYLVLGLSGLLWPKEAFSDVNYKSSVVKALGSSPFFQFLFQVINVNQLELSVICGYAATFRDAADQQKIARALSIGYLFYSISTIREWRQTGGNRFLNDNGLYVSMIINAFFAIYMTYYASPSIQSFCAKAAGKSASASVDTGAQDGAYDDESESDVSDDDESEEEPKKKAASPAKRSTRKAPVARRSPAKKSPAPKKSPAKKSPAKRASATKASPAARSRSPARTRRG